MAAAVLGYDSVVFIDDDEIVTTPDFLRTAMYGLGAKFDDGTPLLAKSGYYTDSQGRYQRNDEAHWTDMFWRQRDAFNQALSVVSKPPRIQRTNIAFGGILALHCEMFTNVSFDPWVLRGEDMDYIINARMHGADVYLDDEWRIVHEPPETVSEAIRFRQDAYRFVYEHRKIEFAKSQVDLRQVTPEVDDALPGSVPRLVGGVARHADRDPAFALAARTRRSTARSRLHTLKDSGDYARENCQHYFEFQRRWPIMMESLWDDVALKSLFSGERVVDRSAITGRFPVVPPA